MTYWFSKHNKEILLENGIDDDFVWGEIRAVHSIGNILIVEYERENGDGVFYHPYIDGKDSNHSHSSLDGAILVALGRKYDGLNSQFARFALRMLGIR